MRYSLNGTLPWQEITLRLTTQGNSGKDVSKYAATPGQTVPAACPETNGQIQTFQLQNLTAGIGLAARTSNVTLDVRCKYEVRALIANPGQAGAAAKILIDSVVLSPDVKETAIYARAGPATQLEYQTCFFNFLQLSTRASSLVPPVCSSLMKSVGIEMEGQALDCLCNQIGTMDNLNMQCNTLGGQCSCKPGVFGRQCDICMPGYYNFTTTGCTLCPELPCPNDPDFAVTYEVEGGGGSSRVLLIIVILFLLILIIIVIVFLIKRKWRETCFRKFGPKTKVRYVDLDGEGNRTPPSMKKVPPIRQTEIPNRPDYGNHLGLNLQYAPDIPGVMEYPSPYRDPAPPPYRDPTPPSRPKPRDRKPKEKTSLKQSFSEIDKYNAMNDKGKQEDENLVEINAEELLQKQKNAMRKELKQHKDDIKNKGPNTKKRPESRQRVIAGTENVAFTNDYTDIAPNEEPETMDNVLNEMQSQQKKIPETLTLSDVPETAIVSSSGKRSRHHSSNSDRSRRSSESKDGRSSSRGDRKKSHHGEKREHRRRKEGQLGDSMKSTDSTRSGRSDRPKRRHSKSSRHGDASPDPKALLMTEKGLNDFTSLEPIDEMSGSLV